MAVAARRLQLPAAGYSGAPGPTDPGGLFLRRCGFGSEGAAAVRPDGYVGRRSAGAATTAGKEFTEAIEQIIGHGEYRQDIIYSVRPVT
ncbi:hypothetical protein ACFZDJ_42015 [Streptomyces sp. NPDC007896]|uniref:hypothetical protein n=1 Tax=Streptomyces sp. NPDC007896 TaxID=3364784 RepID=UPI0036E05802